VYLCVCVLVVQAPSISADQMTSPCKSPDASIAAGLTRSTVKGADKGAVRRGCFDDDGDAEDSLLPDKASDANPSRRSA
jgi:hypothetical protein